MKHIIRIQHSVTKGLLRGRSRVITGAAALLVLSAALGQHAVAQQQQAGIAQVFTSKSLPEATVAVIDPESGTSSGTAGQDVLLAAGDIILFRFNFTPVPSQVNRGLAGYLTEYIPFNTEVVGARFVDENNLTVHPRRAGWSIDGCEGNACTNYSVSCSGGTCSPGSVYDVHADTGIFYTTSPLLERNPANAFITKSNGDGFSSEPANINPSITNLLDYPGPAVVHNEWDRLMVEAFGTTSDLAGTGGKGETPFMYGSPVAGPLTYYRYAPVGGTNFNGTDGPWQRMITPGARIGDGGVGTASAPFARDDLDAADIGDDITPANPARGPGDEPATALRYAMGEIRTGEQAFAEVALRVLDLPIDPNFGSSGGNVDCAEVVGSDVGYRGGNNGDDHPWGYYLSSPACAYLKLLFEVTPSALLAGSSSPISFTIEGSNLSVEDETNVVVRLEHTNGTFVSATPPPTMTGLCPDGVTNCVYWSLGTLAPGEDYEIIANFTTPGGGGTSFIVDGNYQSDSLPSPGYTNQTVSLVTGISVVKAELAQSTAETAAGGTATFTGEVRNEGTSSWSFSSNDSLIVTLPTGWTYTGTWTLSGTTLSCTGAGNVVTCDPGNTAIAAGGSRALSISAMVPGTEPDGLYDIDLQVFGSQSGFGGDYETFFPSIAKAAIGAPRSAPPMLDCPINSSDATAISGTTVEADGTIIRLYFNLIERGDGTSTSGAWEVSNFGAFGELYGGLEVRATAQAPGELESELSDACFVSSTRACSDGVDNDGDTLTDFPADPGCDSPNDNSEDDPPAAQCNNTQDDNMAGGIDWPEDPSCYAYYDPTEDGVSACSDGADNDGDTLTDGADPDCAASGGQTEHTYMACQDGIDNDVPTDGLIDFPADPGCHSEFDNDETDTGQTDGDKARILVILDSSGSMNLDTCDHPSDVNGFTGGDGSDECPGDDVACSFCNADGCDNGEADDSRLYKIKAGLTNVVAAFGEIDWGLMRFFQKDVEFQCPSQNASLTSGAWQGGGAPPCGGGFNAGELLVSFAPDNPSTILNWIDNNSNYPGVEAPRDLDWEVRGSGTTPLGGALDSALTYMTDVESNDVAPADCRPYRVVLLTDGLETCGGDPEGSAAALLGAGMPVYVIGFATADQEIVNQLNAIAMAGGTNQAIFVDDDVELSSAFADIVQETVRFEICDGEDNDCDGDIDEDFPDLGSSCNNGEAGECFDTGTVVCSASDPSTTECNAPPGTSQPEECNGLDDDCDNLIDEGLTDCDCTPFPEVCNNADDDCDGAVDEAPVTGVGTSCGLDGPLEESICEPGMLACNPGGNLECEGGVPPGTEVCNDLDDDCDGQIDEVSNPCYGFATGCDVATGNCVGTCQIGVQTCDTAPGECDGDVGPGTETCNAEDDDCDGDVDEDFPGLGDMCTRGQGVCQTTGTLVCDPNDVENDGDFVRCNALEVSGTDEVCNGLDDDCDGDVDEELGPPFTGCGPDGMDPCPCGGGQGCSGGVFQCNDGVSECVGGNEGATEVCNGMDEDCDSSIDEGTSTFEDCVPPAQQTPCDPDCTGTMICVDGTCVAGDTGECDFGQLECVNGSEQCQGFDGPTPEVCNGEDDNCDGMVDNEAICPNPNNLCVEGTCVFPCGSDEFPCPFGFYCETITDEGDFCLPDPCVTENVQCQPGEFCQSGTGECIDLCDGVNCAEGEMCQNGVCIDCFDTGCPDGQLCKRQDNNVGVCEDDPCYQVECEADEFCREGECVPVGCDPACGNGQICVDGECVTDNCAGVDCPTGRVCDPTSGECTADRCLNVNCPIGRVCQPSTGNCIDDPCQNLNCPDGTQCQVDFDGSAVCTDIVGEYVFAGGSGCGCQSSGGPGQAGGILLMLGLAYLGLGRRRRRKKQRA